MISIRKAKNCKYLVISFFSTILQGAGQFKIGTVGKSIPLLLETKLQGKDEKGIGEMVVENF